MQTPTVTVLVVGYNSRPHLQDCFASLQQMDYPADRLELVLVDNASSDGSVEFVRQRFPAVTIVQTGDNLGFAGGNNFGARQARGEWIATLNPDMRVRPDWLREMVRVALADPEVACVGSRILTWDGRRIDFGGAAMNFYGFGMQVGLGRRDVETFNRDRDILFACGGALLIRRDVFLQLGGFDQDYFAFFEDVDLGWRLWQAGYKVRLAGRAVVYHIHHGAWGAVPLARRQILYERNALYTVFKNYQENNLKQVWPASVMLMLHRAFITSGVDPAPYQLAPPTLPPAETLTEPSAYYDARYYWQQFWCTLQKEGLIVLIVKIQDELARRWKGLLGRLQQRRRPLRLRPPESDTTAIIPLITLSYLEAAEQLVQNYDRLLEKRQAVQARRVRDDQAIFPLFGQPIVSNYPETDYIRKVFVVSHVWDLYRLFGVE